MIRTWNVTLPMLTGTQPRRAYVYVPDSFRDDPERCFPVLYMFDGHNLFFDKDATYGKSWGLADYMNATQTPLIIAAVECSHAPDDGRLSEYAPFSFDTSAPVQVTPRGRETMDWLVKVFKPMIDRRFPTLPDRNHTFIGGSSMGGLMSLYAVTRYNHIFSRAAAVFRWCTSPQTSEKRGAKPKPTISLMYAARYTAAVSPTDGIISSPM